MFESVNYYFICVIVFQHITKPIPLAYHRQDPEEEHDLCNCRLVEHVCPGSKDCLILERGKYHQSIHQCVAVVRRDDYCAVLRDVLKTAGLETPVACLGKGIYYRTEK